MGLFDFLKTAVKDTSDFGQAVVDRTGGAIVRSGIRLGANAVSPLVHNARADAEQFINNYASNQSKVLPNIGGYNEQSAGGKVGRAVGTGINAATALYGIKAGASAVNNAAEIVPGASKVMSFLGGGGGGLATASLQQVGAGNSGATAIQAGPRGYAQLYQSAIGKPTATANNQAEKDIFGTAPVQSLQEQYKTTKQTEGTGAAAAKTGLSFLTDALPLIASGEGAKELATNRPSLDTATKVSGLKPTQIATDGETNILRDWAAYQKGDLNATNSEINTLANNARKVGEKTGVDVITGSADDVASRVENYISQRTQFQNVKTAISQGGGYNSNDFTPQDTEALANAKTPDEVKKILADKVSPNVATDVAKPISLTNNPASVNTILDKHSPALPKVPTDLTSQSVDGVTPPAGQGSLPTPVATSVTPPGQRGFLNTVANSGNEQASNVAGQLQPQTYTPQANSQSFQAANAFVDKNGIEAAHAYLLNDKTPFDATKSGLGQLLQQKYANEGDISRLSQVMDTMDNQARMAGQGIQMLSNWSRLSPEAMFKLANTEADKFGTKLSPDFQRSILNQMKDVQNLPEGSPERASAMQGVLKDIADHLPTTKSEWLNNYRYQNMLSSPTSAEKIGYGGLVNTLITHPVDLFANATVQAVEKGFNSSFDRTIAYSDIPKYYKDIAIGMPKAWQAAVASFKAGNLDKTFEEGKGGASTLNTLRQANIPTALRPFSSLHGAIYKYFSSLIAGGERARLMEHGMSEADATKAAAALGDKLTLRSPLGSGAGSPAVQAVDAIGNFTTKLNDIPVLGTATKWIAPFMKVSTNWAKLAVEHSPLNLIDNPKNITSDQVAKSFVGSVATGIGVSYAMQGKTTWAPPTDPKQRDLWYASGRKPYSVEINGKWVPMTTFGPLALSFALPSAFRDATQNQNKYQPNFNKVVKVGTNASQYIVNNTPLPSVAGFFNLLNGDTAAKPAKTGADVASQAIPLEALQRYVANAMDPTYRKANTFNQRIESGIPGLSQNLPAYKTPLGKPETRNISNFVLPYAYGQGNSTYENSLTNRQTKLTSNAKMKALRQATIGAKP